MAVEEVQKEGSKQDAPQGPAPMVTETTATAEAEAKGQPAEASQGGEQKDQEKKQEDQRQDQAPAGADEHSKEEPSGAAEGAATKSPAASEKAKARKTSVIFADRKITTDENVDNISLYAMCRSWFRNETESEEQAKEAEGPGGSGQWKGARLPPPLPHDKVLEMMKEEPSPSDDVDDGNTKAKDTAMDTGAEATNADANAGTTAEDTSKDALFKKHMKRWKAIRKHKLKIKQVNSERFEERLKVLFPA